MDPNTSIEGLTQAIADRAWYPLFAYLFSLLILIWRTWQPRLFEERDGKPPIIPKGAQWAPALALTGLAAFVEAFLSGLTVEVAVAVTAYAVATGGPLAIGVHRISKELKSGVPTALQAAVLFIGVAGLSGCASMKPVVRTVDDLAREACNFYFSDRMGISLEDAARTYCKVREDWAPFIDPLLRAQEEGGELAAQRLGLEPPDGE